MRKKIFFQILLQVQLEQSISGDTLKTACRRSPCWGAMLALWCAACMVIGAAYKGATLSALVRPSKNEPEDISALVDAEYKIVASQKSIDIIQDLLNVTDSHYSKTMR